MKAIAFIGHSGAGKTTLLEKLLPRLQRDGRRVGYLKTDAHGFSMDVPGKDTARLFDAGAPVAAILGRREAAIRLRPDPETSVEPFLRLAFPGCDLVLVEGGKTSALPKIAFTSDAPLAADGVIAWVGGATPEIADAGSVPRFSRDDLAGIAAFVEAWAAR